MRLAALLNRYFRRGRSYFEDHCLPLKHQTWVEFTDERQWRGACAVVDAVWMPRPQADAVLRRRVRLTGQPRYGWTGGAVRGTVPAVA